MSERNVAETSKHIHKQEHKLLYYNFYYYYYFYLYYATTRNENRNETWWIATPSRINWTNTVDYKYLIF